MGFLPFSLKSTRINIDKVLQGKIHAEVSPLLFDQKTKEKRSLPRVPKKNSLLSLSLFLGQSDEARSSNKGTHLVGKIHMSSIYFHKEK